MPFGDRLRSARIAKGMTQTELGKRLGVSDGAVRMWELGHREPDMQMLKAIAEVLELPASEIIGTSAQPPATGREQRLYDVVARAKDLPDDAFDNVTDAIEALVKFHREKTSGKKKQ